MNKHKANPLTPSRQPVQAYLADYRNGSYIKELILKHSKCIIMDQSITATVPDQREKDIQALCTAVLNMSPNSHYNLNGADTSTCPICYEKVYYMDAGISDITHSPDCAYLIAKDLSTTRK